MFYHIRAVLSFKNFKSFLNATLAKILQFFFLKKVLLKFTCFKCSIQ